jgi:hypothetical protein
MGTVEDNAQKSKFDKSIRKENWREGFHARPSVSFLIL